MDSNTKDQTVIEAAKFEFTEQLIDTVKPFVIEKMISMYDSMIENNKRSARYRLIDFQEQLRAVLDWSQSTVDAEVEKIVRACSWFSELLAAVFVSNVKILNSIKLGKSNDKIQIKMPSNSKFIFNVYKYTAIYIYDFIKEHTSNPIFHTNTMDDIVRNAMKKTISNMLPMQNILQTNLGPAINPVDDDDNNDDGDSDDESPDHVDDSADLNDFPETDTEPPEPVHEHEPSPIPAEFNQTPQHEQQITQPPQPPLSDPVPSQAPATSNDLRLFDPPEVKNVPLSGNVPGQSNPIPNAIPTAQTTQQPAVPFFDDAADDDET